MSKEGTELAAKVSQLLALIEYQEGSVVSRTLIDKITISCKAIRLEQGEMTIMPANEPHALNAKTRFKMLLTMIKS
jgi:hypothetical protein